MKTILDIDYIGNGLEHQKLDIYIPEGELRGTVIYFHGGGLSGGTRKIPGSSFGLASRGYAYISVDYRLRSEVRFPDFIRDAAASVAFIQKYAREWQIPEKFFITGASAGAWIVMMLCLDHHYLTEAGATEDTVLAYLSQSSQMFAHFGLLTDRGIDKRLEIIDETAPIAYLREGLSIKPLLIQYYSNDMLCRPEENRLFYTSIRRFVDTPVEIAEIEGTHCHPDNPEELVSLL